MDVPELLVLSDVPMARIVTDCIASQPALPLNGQRSLIPSPEVAVHKVQDFNFNRPIFIASYSC